MVEAHPADTPLYSAILRPHRSLGPRGFRRVRPDQRQGGFERTLAAEIVPQLAAGPDQQHRLLMQLEQVGLALRSPARLQLIAHRRREPTGEGEQEAG